MNNNNFLFPKIFVLFFLAITVSSCIKNDNLIEGDAKIRFFQAASTDTTQSFFSNGIQLGTSAAAGTNSNYIVVIGDASYKITTRNVNTTVDTAKVESTFGIGKNYSLFYTKTSKTALPIIKVVEDDVKINPEAVKLTFLNLGYTLGSKVVVSDAGGAFTPFSLAYDDSKPQTITATDKTAISFVLETPTATNPQPRVDTLRLIIPTNSSALPIVKGRVYTVLIDGNKLGELKVRLVSAN